MKQRINDTENALDIINFLINMQIWKLYTLHCSFPLEGKTVLGVNLGQPMSPQSGLLSSLGLEKLPFMSHTVK